MEAISFKTHFPRGEKVNGFIYTEDETPSYLVDSFAVSKYDDKLLFQTEFSSTLGTCYANPGDFVVIEKSPVTVSGYSLRVIPEWDKLIKPVNNHYEWKHNSFHVVPLNAMILATTPYGNNLSFHDNDIVDLVTCYGLLTANAHKVLCIYNDFLIDLISVRKNSLNNIFIDTIVSHEPLNCSDYTLAEYLYYGQKGKQK